LPLPWSGGLALVQWSLLFWCSALPLVLCLPPSHYIFSSGLLRCSQICSPEESTSSLSTWSSTSTSQRMRRPTFTGSALAIASSSRQITHASHLCVCVRACVRACVCIHVYMCQCLCACTCVILHAHRHSLAHMQVLANTDFVYCQCLFTLPVALPCST
jgi:hypothetical protein